MKKIFLLAIILFSLNVSTTIATNVPGGLVSGTWTLAGSPYLIQGSIQIPNGSTLSIEPGVSVIFRGAYKINVQGRLLAIGTVTDSITFSPADTTTGWLGIRFNNTPTSNDTSKLFYCKCQYGKVLGGSWPENNGGIFCLYNFSKVIISNCLISRNQSEEGGGIFCYSAGPVIKNNDISHNEGTWDGGAISLYNSSIRAMIINNILSFNKSTFAGGIYSNGNSYLSNNIIANNKSVNSSGGMLCNGGEIINNIIANNTTDGYGGAIEGGADIWYNNAIVNNHAGTNGGGIACSDGNTQAFNNCIIWGNTAGGSGNQIYLGTEASDPNFYYCDIQGGSSAFGMNGNIYTGNFLNNLNSNPLFVSPPAGNGYLFDGAHANWSLQNISPCIDHGGNQESANISTDFAGNPRITVCRIDIGPYEYQTGIPFNISINIVDSILCNGDNSGKIEAIVSGGIGPYTYHWNNNETSAIISNVDAGSYYITVSETSFGCSISDSITLSDPIKITANAGTDKFITCGAKAQLDSVTSNYNGIEPLSYSWSPSSKLDNATIPNPIATVTTDTKFFVTVSNPNSCIAIDSVMVFVNPLTADAGNNKMIFCGGSTKLDSVITNLVSAEPLSYQWSPSEGLNNDTVANPTASVIADTKFYVTVTTRNGCFATDSVTVIVYQLSAEAGTDKQIICGGIARLDSVTSNYTRPFKYKWSPSEGLNNDTIPNPTSDVTHNITYYVSVSSDSGCSATDSVHVYVTPFVATGMHPTPISYVCGGSAQLSGITTNYTGTNSLIYSWIPTGGLNNPGVQNPITDTIKNTTYHVTITTSNGCNAHDSLRIQILPLNVAAGDSLITCGDSVMLPVISNYSGTDSLYYAWSPSIGISDTTSASPYVTIISNQNYSVAISTTNGCQAIDTAVFISLKPMSAPEICIVGVDSVNKNIIVWNKPISTAIDSFYIYRETGTTDIYEKIGAVSFDSVSVFVDSTSYPDVQSNKYKISIFDDCGQASAKSEYHKTMHLTINQGMGNTWNLIWEPYEGFTVSSYRVYRGTAPNNLQQIGTTTSGSTQYTDQTPPAGYVYYQVEVISPNSCNLSKSYNSSRSNVATNKPVGITDDLATFESFSIYPNPANTKIEISVFQKSQIEILNADGQVLKRIFSNENHATIDISEFSKGVYFVKAKSEKGIAVKKLIKE
jgi:hypothetical protein